MIGANPYLYTLDEVAREISPKVGIAFPFLKKT